MVFFSSDSLFQHQKWRFGNAGPLAVFDPPAMVVAAERAFQGQFDGARLMAHARRDQPRLAAAAGEGVDGDVLIVHVKPHWSAIAFAIPQYVRLRSFARMALGPSLFCPLSH